VLGSSPQPVPSKILNVVFPACLRSSHWPLLFHFGGDGATLPLSRDEGAEEFCRNSTSLSQVKLVWEAFPEALRLHGQTIYSESNSLY